jgi:hypothetical protein
MYLIAPADAYPGRMGEDYFIPPNATSIPYSTDYFINSPVNIRIDPSTHDALLSFTTNNDASINVSYGIYPPENELKVPVYFQNASENASRDLKSHLVALDLPKLVREHVHGFTSNGSVIAYRIEVWNLENNYSPLTMEAYMGRLRIDPHYTIIPCVTLGPFVDNIATDSAVISWQTDADVRRGV